MDQGLNKACEEPMRPLEGIAAMTQRVNTATVSLSNFLDRFHGAKADAPDPSEPPPACYSDSFQRHWAAIERLEKRVEAIVAIG